MSYDEQDRTDEVTEDYQGALNDLTMNSRYEIVNLTQIARENTNYAFAISETLQNHIKKVAPQRKLPALYVLDSIVKNIGTPYTLFFGKNLYGTFMEAYASVAEPVRVKMGEMLRTWTEPVPGSIDQNPVFPVEVTRPIDNALAKARASAIQAERQQSQIMGRGGQFMPYRDTATPPGIFPGQYGGGPNGQPAYGNGYPPQGQPYANSAVQHPYNTPQPTANASYYQQQPPTMPPVAGISVNDLLRDIQELLNSTKHDFAQRPLDSGIQGKLKALLELQALVQSQNLPQEQLSMIREQVTAMSVNAARPSPSNGGFNAAAAANGVTSTPPPAVAPPYAAPPASHAGATNATASSTGSVSLDALLGKGALAALLNRQQSATPQGTTPQPTTSQPSAAALLSALRSPQTQNAVPATSSRSSTPQTSNPTALLDALRSKGLLGATTLAGVRASATPPPQVTNHSTPTISPEKQTNATSAAAVPATPLDLASILAKAQAQAKKKPLNPVLEANGIQLTAASLTQFRPNLIPLMYEALGQPCTQCGRRFKTDDDGKKKKVAHMDWHFRVHQRIVEAEKRGQHRSWYVDEADWVKSREMVDSDQAPSDEANMSGVTNSSNANSSSSSAPRVPYIRVPEDGSTNTLCPIDQEKFETKWLADVQEWVWMDAVRVGNRVYHATCYAEVHAGNGGGGPKDTPEPVLGKRKAEDEGKDGLSSLRSSRSPRSPPIGGSLATRKKVKEEGEV